MSPHDPHRTTDLPASQLPGATLSAVSDDATEQQFSTATPIIPGYVIEGELGRGGMGVVFKARHTTLNRSAAIKMILGGKYSSPIAQARFLVEAEVIARLQHPAIVQVYEFGRCEEQPYFVLEYVGGGTLADQLTKSGKATPMQAATLIATLADAMAAAHEQGVVHRDLKPANVLLTEQGEPKVTDFGLAKIGESDMTASGAVMGTPSYMAPEQAAGNTREIGTRTDIYALGTMLYELLTGVVPFRGESAMATMALIRETEPQRPRAIDPMIPRDLDTICLKCLEKNPAHRYPTAAALADDLRRFLIGEPVSVRPAGRAERLLRWVRRKPTQALAWGLALSLLFFGSFAVFAALQWRTAYSAQQEAESTRDAAKQAKEEVADERERMLYARNVYLSHLEFLEGDCTRANLFLNLCPEPLRRWDWHYMHRVCHNDLLTIKAHSEPIMTVNFNHDGSRFVSASWDKTAKVWNADTGECVLTLAGHREAVLSATYSPDGKTIVTTSRDRTAKVWDANTGSERFTLTGHENPVQYAVFSPDQQRILTTSDDATAKLWSAVDGKLQRTFEGHKLSVAHASFRGDGQQIITASIDDTAKIWDVATAKIQRSFDLKESGTFVTFHHSDSQVITVGRKKVWVWDAQSGKEIRSFVVPDSQGASLHTTGKQIVLAHRDGIAKVWDLETGTELYTLKGMEDGVNWPAFRRDGQRIVTVDLRGIIKVWEAESPTSWNPRNTRAQNFLHGHTSVVTTTIFNTTGTLIATASHDNTAKVWASNTGKLLMTFKGHTESLSSVAFNTDSSKIITTSYDDTARIWDVNTGNELLKLQGLSEQINPELPETKQPLRFNSAQFSADDTQILTSDNDDRARLWDVQTGKVIRVYKEHPSYVTSAIFSPDYRQMVTTSWDHTAKIWDVQSGKVILTLQGHDDRLYHAAYSLDGKRLVTTSHDQTAKVWDAQTGKELLTLRGHTFPVGSAAFHPDGTLIVTTGYDETVKIWDAQTGFETITLQQREGTAVTATFSPDGKRLLAGNNNAAKIWDARPVNRAYFAETLIFHASESACVFYNDGAYWDEESLWKRR